MLAWSQLIRLEFGINTEDTKKETGPKGDPRHAVRPARLSVLMATGQVSPTSACNMMNVTRKQ